jgi:hypothetical protein
MYYKGGLGSAGLGQSSLDCSCQHDNNHCFFKNGEGEGYWPPKLYFIFSGRTPFHGVRLLCKSVDTLLYNANFKSRISIKNLCTSQRKLIFLETDSRLIGGNLMLITIFGSASYCPLSHKSRTSSRAIFILGYLPIYG